MCVAAAAKATARCRILSKRELTSAQSDVRFTFNSNQIAGIRDLPIVG